MTFSELGLQHGDPLSVDPVDNDALTSHTVTANAVSVSGAPVPTATVSFVVTGVNGGAIGSGDAITDANGDATFTYTDTSGGGMDNIQALIGSAGSNVVVKTWIPPNVKPTAVVGDVTASANALCLAPANIDAGSFDADGDDVIITLDPAGPYQIGDTLVTLTITEDRPGGLSDTATATVTVVDNTSPLAFITAVAPGQFVPGWNNQDVTVEFSATDNCGIVSQTYELTGAQVTEEPSSETSVTITEEGTTTITLTVIDVGGNETVVSKDVQIDKTAPEFKNVFNEDTLTVDVLALDEGSGVTSDPIVPVCVPTSWGMRREVPRRVVRDPTPNCAPTR